MGDIRVRADTFGYLQRSFPADASRVDQDEARMVGREAVKAAVSGEYASGSVIIERLSDKPYRAGTAITELKNVAKHTKDMPDHFLEDEQGVTQDFIEYASPLVGEIIPMADLS